MAIPAMTEPAIPIAAGIPSGNSRLNCRGNEYRSHRESDNEITSLNAPNVVHIKGRIGEKKDQIHQHNIAQRSESLITATRARVAPSSCSVAQARA